MNVSRSLLLGTVSLGLCTAAAELAGMGTAFGATEHFTASYGSLSTTKTPWTGVGQTVSLPYFNSPLGTLTSVSFELTASIEQTAKITNTGSTAETISESHPSGVNVPIASGATISVAPSGTGTPLTMTSPSLAKAMDTAFSYTQTLTINANSTLTLGSNQIVSGTGSSVEGPTGYTGSGDYVLPLFSTGAFLGTFHGGNLKLYQTTYADATVEVIYTYTPSSQANVPEPGSMLLLGSGLVGLGTMRRRGWRVAGGLDWLRRRRSGRRRD